MANYKKKYTKKVTVRPPFVRQVRDWSPFQQAIFQAVESGTGNFVVMARAGSGKTSTIVEALNYIQAGKSWILVAFNKKICEELQARACPGGDISTLHSLGFRAVMRAFGRVRVDNYKTENLLKAMMPSDSEEKKELISQLIKTVSLAKGSLAESEKQIDEIMDRHGVDANGDRAGFIQTVLQLLQQSRELTGTVDFDDMIWMPNVFNLAMPKYDVVMVDETQDLNPAQLELVMRSRTETGRIIAVGDDRQAIYGFRGADQNAINRIITRTQAQVLPLSVTYRCARAIVAQAQTIVPDIQAAENAETGSVQDCSKEEMIRGARAGDFILSRSNAPMIGIAMGFIRAGIPCNIQGRDIGKNLIGFMKRSKCKEVGEFVTYVETWRDKECARLADKRRDTQATEDKAECLIALCDGAVTLDSVKENISRLFEDTDDKNRIILSSVHKSKGLERDRVWMLSNTFKPGKDIENDNLYYVACTRARKNLYMVAGVK